MVEFGKTLMMAQSRKRPLGECVEYSYLNYDRLKLILNRAKAVAAELQHQEESMDDDDGVDINTTGRSGRRHRRSQSHGSILLLGASRRDVSNKFGHRRISSSLNRTTGSSDRIHLEHLFSDQSNGSLPIIEEGGTTDHVRLAYNQYELLLLEFRKTLDQEIEKVVLCSLEQQGRISQELTRLSAMRESCLEHVARLWQEYTVQGGTLGVNLQSQHDDASKSTRRLIRDTNQAYQALAQKVLDYVSFVELNITAVRKILKKHDKNNPREFALLEIYWSGETSSRVSLTKHPMLVDSHLGALYGSDPGLSALIATLKKAFAELHQAECFTLLMIQSELPIFPSLPSTTSTTYRSSLPKKSSSAPLILSEDIKAYPRTAGASQSTLGKALSLISATIAARSLFSHSSRQDDSNGASKDISPPSSQHHYHQVPTLARLASTVSIHTEATLAREPLLDEIYAARSRLQEASPSTTYAKMVAAQAALFLDDDEAPLPLADDDDEDDQEETNARRSQRRSSLINLASTFLYMTNYYIVAPTTGQYALKLGSSEAMAGIIIGMTPNAALIATVLYGFWSNYSYKSALLFAAGCSAAGNIAYALALHYHSLELVMIGRFLNGFGSARSINRRFIADTFGRAERTAASANFVTAAALGMAAGPAIAVALGKLDDEEHFSTPQRQGLLWTVETAPGWVMLGFWILFFLLALWYFEEPDRSHLFGSTPKSIQIQKSNSNNGMGCSETQALLAPPSDADNGTDMNGTTMEDLEPRKTKPPPLYRNVPVMMTLWIYFVLKLVLECLVTSSATLTKFYFGWDSKRTGAFLAFLGLLMFPANMGVARLSQQYQDRELILGTLMILLASVLGILSYSRPGEYSVIQYMLFGITIFLSTNILEGPNMSLLSKTIPKVWAKGIFNSGFLATEAGTAARSFGDVLIAAAATWQGVENLLNSTFVPMLGLVAISIWGTRYYFDQMVEEDEDDDDEDASSMKSSPSGTGLKTAGTTKSTDSLRSEQSRLV